MIMSLSFTIHQQFDGFFLVSQSRFASVFLGHPALPRLSASELSAASWQQSVSIHSPYRVPFSISLTDVHKEHRSLVHLFTCQGSSAPLHLISPLWFRWFVVVASCAGFCVKIIKSHSNGGMIKISGPPSIPGKYSIKKKMKPLTKLTYPTFGKGIC